MAVQTFRDVWSKVALRVPAAPISLVQDWVQDAYDRLIGRRQWAWTRTFTTISVVGGVLTMPDDFRSIQTVTDRVNQRPIVWWLTSEQLDLLDPGRTYSGQVRAIFPSTITGAGRVTYEPWPTGTGDFALWYFRRPDALADDDNFQGVLATNTGALVQGALAQAALWPGRGGQRNPYFNLALATKLQAEFDQRCKSLDVMDDDQYLQDLQQLDLGQFGFGTASADLRRTDATLSDYY
jgi:hypothetical protein